MSKSNDPVNHPSHYTEGQKKQQKKRPYQTSSAMSRLRSGQASIARAFLRKLDRYEAAKKAKDWVD